MDYVSGELNMRTHMAPWTDAKMKQNPHILQQSVHFMSKQTIFYLQLSLLSLISPIRLIKLL